MPVHIVVDGYNVIGSEQGLRGDLEPKRASLVEELGRYQARTGHSVTTVFDGWRGGREDETRQQVGAVTVVFSRYGEKADAVIERLAREMMGIQCVVVTSDRELRRSVESSGATAAFVSQFLGKMRTEVADDGGNEDGFDSFDDPPPAPDRRKKGNPRRLSRAERVRRERLAKL